MKRSFRLHGFVAAAFAAALGVAILPGCGDDPVQPLPPQTIAPDWHLQDMNPNSATSGQHVTVRGQLGKISAWYFTQGH